VRDLLPQLGLVAFLVLVNALLAGTELALVSLREGQLRRLESRGGAGITLGRLARDPNRFLATIQIGITFAGFLASAAAAVTLAGPLEDRFAVLGDLARPVSVVAVTIVLSYITLVFGELAPKRLALQRAERWGLAAARPLALLSALARPAVWVLSRSTDVVVRLFGGDPALRHEVLPGEEIRDLVAAQVHFTPHQQTIIEGAVEVAERTLREILVPRGEVFLLRGEAPTGESLRSLTQSGFSRAPVSSSSSLDDVVGMVHLRQLLTGDPTATTAELAVELPVFPETLGVLDAMHRMQLDRVSMALVLDEFGGAQGIVTTKDLIEEIVGELYDEIDRDVLLVRHESDGSVLLPGRYPMHDLIDIGLELPTGDYATVAGFVLDRLGRLPTGPGDTVEEAGLAVTVTQLRGRAITEVRVRRRDPSPQEASVEE
jgi:putative hemolysin